jgi:CHAD domain-containing protein
VTDRFLPAVLVEFALAPGEPIATGLRRLSLQQFDAIVVDLRRDSDLDIAVHSTRKATKRVRSILRLVRSEIGDRAYQVENRVLRDASRLLAPIRDDRVMVDTVSNLRDRYRTLLDPRAFAEVVERLQLRGEVRRESILSAGAVEAAAAALSAARARYAAWPGEGDVAAGLYGRKPIRNRFESIEPGLRRTYGGGRRDMGVALGNRDVHAIHSWRKRVKYLRHQVEILNPLFPEILDASAGALDHLGELLGSEHDLAVLASLLDTNPGLCPDPLERSVLQALARHRRSELLNAAQVLGSRIYAESPDRFILRMESYWRSAVTPISSRSPAW